MQFELTGGIVHRAQRVLIYGQHGIGKTTLAAQFPGAIMIDVEDGSGHIDVMRYPRPTDWQTLLYEVADAGNRIESGTLVIDSIDWAERLATAKVCTEHEMQSIESFGYGKGYVYVADEVRRLLRGLDRLIEKGVNVVLVAHEQITTVTMPGDATGYSIFGLKLSKQIAALVKEWADAVLYCHYRQTVVAIDKDGTRGRALGGTERVMQCTHTTTIDAKNRWGIDGEVPMSIEQIMPHVAA